jgi:hypothetical protein
VVRLFENLWRQGCRQTNDASGRALTEAGPSID